VPDFFLAFHPLSFITIVMSLLAVVFSFDAVCGEKSQGTLKLMLAAGVPRGTLLAGKWLGGLAAVALPFLLGVLVSALVVLVVLSGSLSASHWVAMGAILLLSLLFLSVVYSAGMLVSSLTAEPATSAACLLLLWALAFLGYPNLAPVLASWLRPTPTPAESRKEQRSQLDEVRKTTEALFAQFEKEWEPRKDDPQSRNDYWVEKRKFYVEQEKLMGPALEKFHESQARVLEAQVELTNSILRAAPLGSYILAFDELAGTGSSERSRLLSAVTRYQTRFFVYFAGRSVQMVEKRKALGITDMPPYSTGDFPLFECQESTVPQRSSRSLFDVVLLAAWNVLLFVGAYASFLRYDVS